MCCHCSTVGMTKSIPRRMVHRDYRGFGLCWTCYREAERQGTLATWRAHYDQTINAGEGFSGRAALRLARLTGATEAAEILGVSLAIFRSWVPWDGNPDPEPVPMDLRWTLWMTLRAAEREEKET